MSVQCPPGSFVYKIRAGDTLYRLAQVYGTTVSAIIATNPGLNPSLLQIGQTICIPGTTTEICPPGTTVHIIQSGDTLYALAVRYQTSVAAIIAANPRLNPNTLYIGQPVCIPQVITCPGGNIYTVQPGDTLFLIATRFDVSFGALAEFNPGLDPNRIFPGQRICIPPVHPFSCPGNNNYVIQPGENLSSIAEKFTVSAADILIVNPGLRPSEFMPGRTVCIPLNQAPV